MTNVLITGATGNVGLEVLRALSAAPHGLHVVAGVRSLADDHAKLDAYAVQRVAFDVTQPATFGPALSGCQVLFLLRPPQISAVNKYFKPILAACRQAGVQHIVFLSVQGVQQSSIIPHHKIERLIVASGIAYTFLRPAYFMQNFTTTLRADLVERKRIFLPAGKARFTLVDVRDIGQVAAAILANPSAHQNTAYELTSHDLLTFEQMAATLSAGLGRPIRYESPGLWRFFWAKRREKLPTMLILVMIMLHYLPRFQAPPATTDWVEKLSGHAPTSFEGFVEDFRVLLGGGVSA